MQLSFGLYYKEMYACVCICMRYFCNGFFPSLRPSSFETQGQMVGARESLNGRKNKAQRKVKNGEKSPWGQCLTRPVPTVAAVLASDWCQKNTSFLAPIRSQNGGDRLELVW